MFTVIMIVFLLTVLANAMVKSATKGNKKMKRSKQIRDNGDMEIVWQEEIQDYELSMNHCIALEKYEDMGITFSDKFVEKFAIKQFASVEKAIQYIETKRRGL